MLSIDSFAKGIQARIVLNCNNCPVVKAIPIPENENILDLYQELPQTFDSFGNRVVDLNALKLIFDLNNISKELHTDYGRRILYFNSQLIEARNKLIEKKMKEEVSDKREKRREKNEHLYNYKS